MHPQDLEKALASELQKVKSGKRVSIEDDDFPEVVTKYLNANFYVHRSAATMKRDEFKAILDSLKEESWPKKLATPGKAKDENAPKSTLVWIGKEQEFGWLWMHLELTAPKVESDNEKLWMVNRILFDSVERQENTVAVDSVSNKKFKLQFRIDEEFQELKPAK